MITSMDDFYILDSHMIVTETSNSILDPEVWKQVVPESALSWQRVLAANWLSDNGMEWAHWVKQHNSGQQLVWLVSYVAETVLCVCAGSWRAV